MAFREAHDASGKCVALAEGKGIKLSDISLGDLKTVRYVCSTLFGLDDNLLYISI